MTSARAARSDPAVLYRTAAPDPIGPFGLKSRRPLRPQGFQGDDCPLRSPAEQDAFKTEYDVRTSPQTFTSDERVGEAWAPSARET